MGVFLSQSFKNKYILNLVRDIAVKKVENDTSLDYFTCQCGNVLIFNMSIKCLKCGRVYDFFSSGILHFNRENYKSIKIKEDIKTT